MKWNMFCLTLFLSILILMVSNARAQPYPSLFSKGDYSTSWIQTWENLNFGGIMGFRYEKDTLVHGVHYKKVISTRTSSTGRNFPGGLFREDTSKGWVWYRDVKMRNAYTPLDTMDRLAFRFDLQVGDTFDLNYATRGFPDSLCIVDSVRTINGLKHIYFKAPLFYGYQYGEPLTFIEGIGSNVGIVWKHGSSSPGYMTYPELYVSYLLCSYKNGYQTPYQNRRYDGDCEPELNLDALYTETEAQSAISFYPQPASNTVWIKNNGSHVIKRLQVFTLQGRLIQDLTGNNITQWEIRNLTAGVYFVKVYSGKGYLTSKRLILN